jgi:hypothetical protein
MKISKKLISQMIKLNIFDADASLELLCPKPGMLNIGEP